MLVGFFLRFYLFIYLGWLHLWLLWIKLLWTFVYKFVWGPMSSVLLHIYLEVELLEYRLILCLSLWGPTRLFSKVAAPFYKFLPAVYGDSGFSTSLLTVIIIWFDYGHPTEYMVVSPCSFDFHFPRAPFHVFIGHLHIFFEDKSIRILCPVLVGLSFYYWDVRVLYII